MRRVGVAALSLSLAAFGGVGAASAYEVVEVANGGKITGKVTVNGEMPDPKAIKVEKTPEVCGEADRLLEEVRRGNDGGFADVVLYLTNIEKGKPFAAEVKTGGPKETPKSSAEAFRAQSGESKEFPGTTLEPQNCLFGAFTGVVANGKLMRFANQDPVKHSPHTYAVKGKVRKSMFNQDLEGKGKLDVAVEFQKASETVLKLECDQHNHMQNWFLRVDNPYYSFSAEDGSFTIENVPPGEYELIAWHPKAQKEQKQKVTVSAAGAAEVAFAFTAKGERLK